MAENLHPEDSHPRDAIILYDIGHRDPKEETCSSPNPWKSRLALNFKDVPYTTVWIPLPEVGKARRSLNLPAGRKFADGTDFYTLPIMRDYVRKILIGDSFDIAVHLQRTYPDSGAGDLFPAQILDFTYEPPFKFPAPLTELADDAGFAEYVRFNTNVDAAFTTHVALMVNGIQFDPATAEESKAEFVRRSGVSSWDDFTLTGKRRDKVIESFRAMLGNLAKLFIKDPSGPFLLGQQANYGDLIVGAWLRMAQKTLPTAEWEDLRGWHGGIFGWLHDSLDRYAQVK